MTNILSPQWKLQDAVNEAIRATGFENVVFGAVRPEGEALWDNECPGLGRCAWTVDLSATDGRVPSVATQAMVSKIDALRARYDLGVVD